MMKIIVAFRNFQKAPKNPHPVLMFLLGLESAASQTSILICSHLNQISYNVFEINPLMPELKSLRATLPAEIFYWEF
jgi:hypothetical protein